MSLLSWSTSSSSRAPAEEDNTGPEEQDPPPVSTPPYQPLDFDTIADVFDTLQGELASALEFQDKYKALQEELTTTVKSRDDANMQCGGYKTQLQSLEKILENQRKQLASLKALLATEKGKHTNVQKQNVEANREIKRLRQSVTQSQTRLTAEAKHARVLEQQYVDTKFDLEYLKCTTSTEQPCYQPIAQDPDSPLLTQPFVVVLVDGDAYKVSPAAVAIMLFAYLHLNSGRPTFSSAPIPSLRSTLPTKPITLNRVHWPQPVSEMRS